MKPFVGGFMIVLLCWCHVADIQASTEDEDTANGLLSVGTDTDVRGGGGWYAGSYSYSAEHKPPRRPPLMDTSFECCKDIQGEMTEMKRDLMAFSVKLSQTSKQLAKENSQLMELQALTMKTTAASQYLVNDTTSVLDIIEHQLVNINKPIYANFAFDLLAIINSVMSGNTESDSMLV